MADAKLEIQAGSVSFSGEGTEVWLAEQLDKVLAKLGDLRALGDATSEPSGADNGAPRREANVTPTTSIGTLAGYLKDKKATSNQSRKFLATAAWLQLGGMNRVSTGEVTKNLNTHNQGKLTNPAQCLINNASKGNVVKDGKQFYVVEKGFEELAK